MPADAVNAPSLEFPPDPLGSRPPGEDLAIPSGPGDDPTGAADRSPRRPSRKTIAGSIVAVFCVYEVLAETVNRFLDIDLLPSTTGWVRRWSARGVVRAMEPPVWMRNTAVLDLGFMVHVLGAGRRRRNGAGRG
jgi:hypothetical protein